MGSNFWHFVEQAFTEESNCTSKENSCNHDECKAGGHDHTTIRYVIWDPENQTESDGSTNQSCIPYEE